MFQSARQVRGKTFLYIMFDKVIGGEKGSEYIALRRQDVNTLSGIDSSVISRKFEGMLELPFL